MAGTVVRLTLRMNPAKRHLRVVPDPASPVTRDEIAVRFTSTSGWALTSLRKPLNSFRWRGPGTLRFDGAEQGILVTAKEFNAAGTASDAALHPTGGDPRGLPGRQ